MREGTPTWPMPQPDLLGDLTWPAVLPTPRPLGSPKNWLPTAISCRSCRYLLSIPDRVIAIAAHPFQSRRQTESAVPSRAVWAESSHRPAHDLSYRVSYSTIFDGPLPFADTETEWPRPPATSLRHVPLATPAPQSELAFRDRFDEVPDETV